MAFWENLCWEKLFRKTHYLFEKDLFRKTHDLIGKNFLGKPVWEKPILCILRVGPSLGTVGSLQNHKYSVWTCQTHASLLISLASNFFLWVHGVLCAGVSLCLFVGWPLCGFLSVYRWRSFPYSLSGPCVEFLSNLVVVCRWRCPRFAQYP